MKCYGCLTKGFDRNQVDRHHDGHTYCFDCLGRCTCGFWPKSYCAPPCPVAIENERLRSLLTGFSYHPTHRDTPPLPSRVSKIFHGSGGGV